jgi:nucleobase:cation symporter-1, NCS1 family
MLRAIFGDSFAKIPNHITASMGITTKGTLSFFLFWLIHFFFCFFRSYQLKKFFWFKGFIMLPAVFGVFIYCMVETNGQIGSALATSPVTSGMGWAIMYGINSGLGYVLVSRKPAYQISSNIMDRNPEPLPL